MRYIPTTDGERKQMLAAIGVETIDELFDAVPEHRRSQGDLALPHPLAEHELVKHMGKLAASNQHMDQLVSFLGAGVYDSIIPAAVKHVVSRGEFLTAYTPYQAEISQGVLQAIFEFQTLIAELTGMDAANASMYDGATALAEAALLSCNATRRDHVFVAGTLHPEWMQVLHPYLHSQGITLTVLPYDDEVGVLALPSEASLAEAACLIVQQPNFFGAIEAIEPLAEAIHNAKGLLVMAVDPLTLGILKSPGDYGADIAVGDGQQLGNPPGYGGPSLGFFATSKKLVRRMPGRIVGETVDSDGQRGYVLTLQTREQHIRREKATSNICTNQALNALSATVFLALIGREGLHEASNLSLQKATYLKTSLASIGLKQRFTAATFREFCVQASVDWDDVNKRLLAHGFLGGCSLGRFWPELSDCVLLAVTEARTKEEIDRFVDALGGIIQ